MQAKGHIKTIINMVATLQGYCDPSKGLFTYYIITEGEGGSSMITLHVIVTWVSTVKVITEGRGG